MFEGRHFQPEQTVLFIRGVRQGTPTAQLARELRSSRTPAMEVRHALQAHAERRQPPTQLDDLEVETDALFQKAGAKGTWHGQPAAPPRRRANKRRGRGTYDNDRPPVWAGSGRQSGKVRIRVMKNPQGATLCPCGEQFTKPEATLYTDEYDSYNKLSRGRVTVCHAQNEWARDADGDGIREAHVNSNEGGWTGTRNFLRPCRGVPKAYLAGYVAIQEFSRNDERISPALVSQIVRRH